MGFFDLKATCSVCHGEANLNRKRIANKKWICSECYKKSGVKMSDFINQNKPVTKWTTEEFVQAIQSNNDNQTELDNFKPTKKIGSLVEFDDNQKKWLVLSAILGKRNKSTVYKYSDIVDFELLEDGESIAQGGLGRALVGGALFGGTGAVVGGVTGKRKNKGVCTNLKIKITVNDISKPVVYIPFIESKVKKSGFLYKEMYKQAHECLSTLQLICDQNKDPEIKESNPVSVADELKKFKELLDMDAISLEEYEDRKKQLLNS